MTTRSTMVFAVTAMMCIVAPAFAQTSYDGLWNVTVMTKTGSCEPSTRYPLTVTDGKISGATEVSGTIARDGFVKVSLHGAYANGQLNGTPVLANGTAPPVGSPAAGVGRPHDRSNLNRELVAFGSGLNGGETYITTPVVRNDNPIERERSAAIRQEIGHRLRMSLGSAEIEK